MGETSRAPRWAIVVGTFFGAGLAPKAPGTVGSLASLVVWAPLALLDVAWPVRLAVAAALFAAGTAAAEAVVRGEGRQDPQHVVMDEVVGMGLTLLFATTVADLALGFAAFRLFDIAKPWPVSLADRRVKGGFGVMLDDVLAGLYALGAVTVVERFLWPQLVALTGAGGGT